MRKRQRKKNVDKWQKRAQWEIDKMVRNGMTYIHFSRNPSDTSSPSAEMLCKEAYQMMKAIKSATPLEDI